MTAGGDSSGRRVVVTGGAGFIGSHLCDALIERGDEVCCVDSLVGTDNSTRNIGHLLAHPRFRFIDDDILWWVRRARVHDVDCIFHQAASKGSVCGEDPGRDLRVNAAGTLRLLELAQAQGVRKFVHASTGSVYGTTEGVRSLATPLRPVSFYGVSKLAAEGYCNLFPIDVTILRYFHVIGPRQGGRGVVPTFIRQCLKGGPLTIHGTGEQGRSFTSVHDVVRANLWASEHSGGVYNVASGINASVAQLADFIVQETGADVEIEHGPQRPNDAMKFDIDTSGVGIDFNTDWRASVREAIEWERGI